MTINIAAIGIFLLGILLKYIAFSLSHDSENHKPNYFKPAAVTSIIFALFGNLSVSNLRLYGMLFLITIFILGLANKFIFRSRFGGYVIASYIGMWLTAPYAVYLSIVR